MSAETGEAENVVPPLVLIVEDEPQMMRFLRAVLPSSGYRVIETQSGQQALTECAARSPDLVLLDLGLPDMDGVDVTRRIREWSRVPIIVISAREAERHKVEALDVGADDYLTKPFSTAELLARMRVALRHGSLGERANPSAVFTCGDLRVDLAERRVSLSGNIVHLTRTEYNLLAVLAKHAGKVITHRQLLKEVWGPGAVDHAHYVRVFMGQLRRKLEADPARPRYLLNEIGVGYRLNVD
ncbi:MAG: response regulator [Vicinamibacteria bacterium]|jgi:two-component system KDP operon response regulator KdpE|nr:response regulator [Vicinamibacteria bacterium]